MCRIYEWLKAASPPYVICVASGMCLSLPGKVVAVEGDFATVDYGRVGQRDNVRIDLVEVEVGNFVLVQGGFAVKVLSEEEAEQTLRMWEMVYEEMEGGEIGALP